jgi:uncharacterized membrane protein YhhN
MSITLIGIPLLVAALDWLAVLGNWRPLKYFTKPGVMIALLAWLWLSTGLRGTLLLFALGLIFSLLGDVFLMLPARFFLTGLVSFLIAQLVYITAFNHRSEIPIVPALLLTPVVLSSSAFFCSQFNKAIIQSGKAWLRIPLSVYFIILSLMVVSALLTLFRPEWLTTAAFLAAGGGLLFFVSDNLLAWNRFVSPVWKGQVWVRITYHLGQTALIAGAALNYYPG